MRMSTGWAAGDVFHAPSSPRSDATITRNAMSDSISAASASPRAPRIGTPEHFRWLGNIVKVVLTLNLLDAIFTMVWVTAGLANEANPLLATLVRDHPLVFVAVKLSLVGGGSWLLWQHRKRPLAVVGIFVVFLSYYCLLLLHVGYLSLILGTLLFP